MKMEGLLFFIGIACYFDLKDELKKIFNAVHAVNGNKLKNLKLEKDCVVCFNKKCECKYGNGKND